MPKTRHREVGSNITSQQNKIYQVPHKKSLGECLETGQAMGHRGKVRGLPRKDQSSRLQRGQSQAGRNPRE